MTNTNIMISSWFHHDFKQLERRDAHSDPPSGQVLRWAVNAAGVSQILDWNLKVSGVFYFFSKASLGSVKLRPWGYM